MEFKVVLNQTAKIIDNYINRIKVEFKVFMKIRCTYSSGNINRIKVEFKGYSAWKNCIHPSILIESKWNLKEYVLFARIFIAVHINRIKVEFKGV